MNMNKALLLVVIVVSLHLCDSSESCCFQQHLDLAVENNISEVELLVGENFNMTCSVNKTVHNCVNEVDQNVNCTHLCYPEQGLAMWFCRQNNMAMEDMKCLGDQIHLGPHPSCLKYDHTTSDDATTFSLSYIIPNGRENDSDTYYCVAGSPDACFNKHISSSSVKVTFKEGRKPYNATISSCPSYEHPIKEGSPVNLSCESEGYPTPSITWFHKGKYGTGHFLTFDYIRKENGGNYYCEASNQEGNDTSKTIHLRVDTGGGIPVYIWIILSLCAAVILVVTLIFIIWRWRHRKSDNRPANLRSQTSNGGGDQPPTTPPMYIDAHNSTVLVSDNISVTYAGSGYQRLNDDSSFVRSWFIYNHTLDASYVGKLVQKMDTSSAITNLKITLWKEHSWLKTWLLYKKIKNNNRTIIIRTYDFIREREKILKEALSHFDESQRRGKISCMLVVSLVEDDLPDWLSDARSLSYDDSSFEDDFIQAVSSLRADNRCLSVTTSSTDDNCQ